MHTCTYHTHTHTTDNLFVDTKRKAIHTCGGSLPVNRVTKLIHSHSGCHNRSLMKEEGSIPRTPSLSLSPWRIREPLSGE